MENVKFGVLRVRGIEFRAVYLKCKHNVIFRAVFLMIKGRTIFA